MAASSNFVQLPLYTIGCMEHPEVHLGVGKLVDIGVHQLILDTPVWWALCDVYNEGRYKPTPRSSSVDATACACALRTS